MVDCYEETRNGTLALVDMCAGIGICVFVTTDVALWLVNTFVKKILGMCWRNAVGVKCFKHLMQQSYYNSNKSGCPT